jgi:hypothetical protein
MQQCQKSRSHGEPHGLQSQDPTNSPFDDSFALGSHARRRSFHWSVPEYFFLSFAHPSAFFKSSKVIFKGASAFVSTLTHSADGPWVDLGGGFEFAWFSELIIKIPNKTIIFFHITLPLAFL